METKASIIHTARKTIETEAAAIQQLATGLNDDFEAAIHLLAGCRGRIVISGIGKSAIIAQKMVATLNSTGSPAVFLHAADAIHGDIGMVQQSDVVILISKSGESPEIKVLVPLIKSLGNPLIGMVGNTASFLARKSNYILDTTVSREACPNNLAPTTSTTAQLVMGDAVAICLMELRGFNGSDFAKLHPGGMLGKQLYLRVSDLYTDNQKPEVRESQPVKEVIMEMTGKRLGVTAVTSATGKLVGIITDGDLRRMLERDADIHTVLAKDIMTTRPKTIAPDEMAVTALALMRQYEIMHLVVSENEEYLGILHLHDLIKEGLI